MYVWKAFTLGYTALIYCIKLFLKSSTGAAGVKAASLDYVTDLESVSLSQESVSNSLGSSKGLSGYVRIERNGNFGDKAHSSFASNDLWSCLPILDISNTINVNPSKLNRCY